MTSLENKPFDYRPSATSGASPGESPYYNRAFWGSYKGLARGLLAGIGLGAGVGAMVGGGLAMGIIAFAPGIASAVGGAAATAGITVAASAALGARYYVHIMELAGANAGAVSAAMEVNELRQEVTERKIDKILDILEREHQLNPAELDGFYEKMEALKANGSKALDNYFKDRPPFYFKTAAVGAVAGTLLGGLLGVGGEGLLANVGLASEGASTTFGALSTVMAGGGALAGATFGINRHYYRQAVNFTNALYEGDLKQFDLQRSKELENAREVQETKAKIEAIEKGRDDLPKTYLTYISPLEKKVEREPLDPTKNRPAEKRTFQSRLAEESNDQQRMV